MAELGSLYYSLHVKDYTAQDIEAINKRLKDIGSNIEINPENFRRAMEKAGETPIKVNVEPKDGLSEKISEKIKDKAIEANIKPLTDTLVSSINSALAGKAINIDTFTINGEGIRNAIQTALQANGFQAVGEQLGSELAKSVKLKFEGQTYTANVGANVEKMSERVMGVLAKAEQKEIKVKADTKELKSMVENILKEKIKVQLDPQTQSTIADIEGRLQGKFVRVAVKPLATDLVQGIKDALRNIQTPPEVNVAVRASTLEQTINTVLQRNGYILNVSSVTGLQTAIRTILQGTHPITLSVDPNAVATSVRTALQNMQSKTFGLEISKDVLYRSIEDALRHKKFDIQIQVMQNQARQAVQNALNQASNITPQNARTYKDLETGNLRKEQTELVKLRQAHLQAKSAADAHARASINLGSALGGNIRIAGELGAAMASLYSIHAAKEFLASVIEIGGELEHQKIALDTIYGDPGKTLTLFSQIKGMARNSPFGVMDLTKNIKQLSAYGVEYNEVYETAKRLADISAATSVDINRLILAFGKTKNRTFLDGLEAKQFAYANIPIYDALSKKLTELEGKFVSVKDVMGRIKKKEIGFDMVKEILWDMTDEGGKFYNMQEKLAGSVKTSWKLVRDNIELMFGEIAESGVGDGLKWLAELLQGLTREWKTLAVVIGSMAAVWGVSKIAMMTHATLLEKNTLAAIKNQTASKMQIYHNNMAAMSYRNLTQAEEDEYLVASGLNKVRTFSIFKRKQLTLAEVDAMMASKALTREEVLKLVALKRIDTATAQYALTTTKMTAAEFQAMNAEIARAHAAKRLTVIGNQLKASLAGIGNALKGLFLNPFTWIMAAFGAVMYLWQKNNAELEKAKEIGDNLFTKAVEGAKNLEQTLKDLKPSNELSKLELTQGIETLENAIKDYSPSPLHDINEALYTQDGLLRPLAERYDELKKKVEELKGAFDQISDAGMSDLMEGAINFTDGWWWWEDNLITTAKNLDKSIKDRNNAITAYYTENTKAAVEAVKAALEVDESFREATKEMTNYAQMFRELAVNQRKYFNAVLDPRVANAVRSNKLADFPTDIIAYENKMNEQMGMSWEFIANKAKEEGIENLSEATDEIKKAYAIMIKDTINGSELSDDVKNMMFDYYSGMLKFDFENINAEEGIIKALNKGLEEKIGSALMSQIKNGLELSEEDRNTVFEAFEKIYGDLYETLPEAAKQAYNNLVASVYDDGILRFDRGKEMSILATLNVRADWEQWQTEIDDNLGNLPEIQTWIKGQPDIPSFIKAVNEGYKDAKEIVDKLEPLMLKAGIEFTPGEEITAYSLSWSKSTIEAVNNYNEAVKAIKGAQKASEELGFKLDEGKKKKTKTGTQKDKVAEEFKQRLKDIKDAWSEYKKWEKSVGDEAAANQVADSGLFSNMGLEEIPRTAEEYQKAIEKIRDELQKKGVKGHSQRESLLNEILKTLLDVKKEIVDEQIKKALDTVDEEIERKLEEYNLYEKVRKATGNKNLAFAFTFGLEGEGETDFIKLTKDNFNRQLDAVRSTLDGEAAMLDFETVNRDNVTLLPEEVQKAWQSAVKAIEQYRRQQKDFVADLLSQYQNTTEKIAKIDADTEETISKIWNDANLNDAQKTNLEIKVQVRADYEKFQLSNDYLQFFNGVYALTLEEAQRIGDAIRTHLNEQLQNGAISAKDYADEIAKIEEQIEKVRDVRPKWQKFLSGGLMGIKQQDLDKATDERFKVIQEIQSLEEKIKKAEEEKDEDAVKAAKKELAIKEKELTVYDKIVKSISESMKSLNEAAAVMDMISNVIHGISDAVGTLREMAGSFGFDTDSNEWLDVNGILDTFGSITDGISNIFQSALKGDIGGIISGVFDTLISPITIWNKIHDRKLEKDIEKSQALYDHYQNLIDILEGKLTYFLGNRRNLEVDLTADERARDLWNDIASVYALFGMKGGYTGSLKEAQKYQDRIDAYEKGGALGYERQLMIEQLGELERQRSDFEKMKGDHSDDIEDMTKQIEEQKQAIKDFSEEMANTVYGIDLNGWASQIGDALVDAFSRGEDAAEAFKTTVGDIMRNLVSQMITADIIAPAMKDLEEWLFGKDGMGGAYGEDFLLDEAEAGMLAGMLGDLEGKIEVAKDLYDAVNGAMGGGLDNKDGSENSVRAGIQSITEDTADLLASYVNSIRAYVAQNSLNFDSLVNEAFPRLTIIAEGQLIQLNMISENTRRNMEAAEAMRASVANLEKTMKNATISKDNGFYVR